MSTMPVSPTTPSKFPHATQGPGPETHNYHKPGLPVLSFSYALYCDSAFSAANFKIWVAARKEVPSRDYRGYLEPYRWDQARRFPMAAIDLIAVKIPNDGDEEDKTSRYYPKPYQAWEMMAFLVAEVTGAQQLPLAPGETQPGPAPTPPPPRIAAAVNNDRPLLSCLAVIFLNEDVSFRTAPETFLAGFGISADARAILTKFGQGQAPFLSPGQGLALLPDLVAEFVKLPATW